MSLTFKRWCSSSGHWDLSKTVTPSTRRSSVIMLVKLSKAANKCRIVFLGLTDWGCAVQLPWRILFITVCHFCFVCWTEANQGYEKSGWKPGYGLLLVPNSNRKVTTEKDSYQLTDHLIPTPRILLVGTTDEVAEKLLILLQWSKDEMSDSWMPR